MNETEYLSMPAEERHEFFADKVMGGERLDLGIVSGTVNGRDIAIPDYDTPEGVWRIVERMRGEGWDIHLYLCEGKNACQIKRDGADIFPQWSFADNIWLAVQLAALRAAWEIE